MDIKILHVLKSNSYSGAENVVITLIRSMREAFPDEYEMIYVSPEGPIREVLKRENILFEPLNSFNIKELNRVCKKHKPEIVHAHDFTASILCAVTKKKYNLISHLHNNPPWIGRVCSRSLCFIALLTRYNKVVCVSQSIPEEFVFHALSKAIVLPNPVDINRIRALAKTSANAEEYDIVFLGRLTQQKDPLRFISIIDKIRARFPELRSAMIGDGELRLECEEMIKTAGLEKNVTLSGFMDNPYPVLAKGKILCMPSIWEGFGLVAVEALALGVPAVVSPVGGLTGIVDKTCGALCDSDEDFIDAISKMLTDSGMWAQKSRGALKKADEMDNLFEYVNAMHDIYCDLRKDGDA